MQLVKLNQSVIKLNQAMDGVSEFTRAAQHAIDLWQFKNEPRLIKIQKLLSKYQV